MSKYTTELRYICEVMSGLKESTDRGGSDAVIKAALPKLFNFTFPIFDEAHRSTLEEKIVRHYYTREIGMETVGLFQFRLQSKLNEIMSYYNKLYLAIADEKLDVYNNVNYQRVHNLTGKQNGSNDNTANSHMDNTDTGNGKNLFSDTPQGGISKVEAGDYLSNATITSDSNAHVENANSTSKTTTVNSTTEDLKETITGKEGSMTYAKMLEEYKSAIFDVDIMVIEELEELFIQLW